MPNAQDTAKYSASHFLPPSTRIIHHLYPRAKSPSTRAPAHAVTLALASHPPPRASPANSKTRPVGAQPPARSIHSRRDTAAPDRARQPPYSATYTARRARHQQRRHHRLRAVQRPCCCRPAAALPRDCALCFVGSLKGTCFVDRICRRLFERLSSGGQRTCLVACCHAPQPARPPLPVDLSTQEHCQPIHRLSIPKK